MELGILLFLSQNNIKSIKLKNSHRGEKNNRQVQVSHNILIQLLWQQLQRHMCASEAVDLDSVWEAVPISSGKWKTNFLRIFIPPHSWISFHNAITWLFFFGGLRKELVGILALIHYTWGFRNIFAGSFLDAFYFFHLFFLTALVFASTDAWTILLLLRILACPKVEDKHFMYMTTRSVC